ncbi:DNA-binding response regulator, NarL/FixJ family, contains REC and HTH domains [Tessaracoccus bendigoensis DSM 12906]|uniref:DNA-binding response regulator, NarL/FixJ family, contains REC and HTH domains n=1 Tax=Tessaracoccus bendigoensis DSM 12906 TaxID=1123357 RepID=A0A1M6HXP0_9ACTN|nr:response regulator transcription factor [Tessaracoccus bendigoensis]SHJ26975.1 DNA-binding response regulator, NarL/FixJ family, contains REC and HTH domains [Tessaracoccus bendigoensis DSM 12906]
MTATVLIVDDHPVVRSGLRAVLEGHPDVQVVGDAATGEEAIDLAARLRPAVVLCDLRLGAGIDGIEATRALRSLVPPPAVLILTTFDRDAEVLGAIEAGASGYLLKDVAPEVIVRAILQAAAGETFLTPELTARVLAGMRSPRPRLTEREVEVLRLLAEGQSNREIARSLFVTEATVKSHLAHIFTKLDVDSRSRAVHLARETGLL